MREKGILADLLFSFRKSKSAILGTILIICIAFVAIFASILAPYDPYDQELLNRLDPPSTHHILGTDSHGRDIFSRIIYGSRISLTIGTIAVGIALGLGLLSGLSAGYFGGMIEEVIMRIVDIVMAFPAILLAIVIVSILGPSLFNAMIAIGISTTPTFARLVRSSTLSIRELTYVESARAIGTSTTRILGRHILPNVLAPLIVISTLRLARAIISAATLSFLGLGAQPPTADWGAMLSSGRSYMLKAWWISVFPGIAIMITVLGFNLLGDGIRDILDPKLRHNM